MASEDAAGDAARDSDAKRRRRQARHYNDRLKMIAGALDRLSTVVLGGAVLAPIFQQQALSWRRTSVWIAVALV
jgi:hypothetical protein